MLALLMVLAKTLGCAKFCWPFERDILLMVGKLFSQLCDVLHRLGELIYVRQIFKDKWCEFFT